MRRYLRNPGSKRELLISEFKGLHTGFGRESCPDGYSPDMKNISAHLYPELASRRGREKMPTPSGEVLFFGVIEGKYLSLVQKLNGVCSWMYYDEGWKRICSVEESESGRYDMIYFINATVLVCGCTHEENGIKYGVSYALTMNDGKIEWVRETHMPLCDMVSTINGRLAAAYSKSADVYLGGAMDRSVWFDIDDGLHLNIITQSRENIAALKTYGGHLVCFKNSSFGEIYGNTPDTYTHITVSDKTGCVAEKTICDCGRLLWLAADGVYSYGGGALPKKISSPIQGYIENADKSKIHKACAGFDGKHYIISIPQSDGENTVCVLDVDSGIWTREDDTVFKGFCNFEGRLYGITEENEIFQLFSSEQEDVLWQWESKTFGSTVFRKKGLRRIYIEAEFTGSMGVSIINDSGEIGANEVFLNESTRGGKKRFYIDPHPGFLGRCNTFSINLQGEGKCRIIGIGMLLRNKNISYL